jgi:peroxiredoxin
MKRRLLLFVASVLFGVALGLAILEGVPESRDAATSEREDSTIGILEGEEEPTSLSADVTAGSLAPDFNLRDLEGELAQLSDYRGQVVLLNFWATWCGPCRIEMPAFQRKFIEHRQGGFIVLGIDFDEREKDVLVFRDGLNLTFPLLLDPGAQVHRLYRIHGYPSSVFIDGEGIIRVIHIGLMTESQLDGYLVDLGIES